MSPRLETQADLDTGLARLTAADPRFAAVLAVAGPPMLRRRPGGFAGLASIIVSQQLSTASANAIWTRLAASSVNLSAISSEDGKNPAAKICCTIAAASDMVSNDADKVTRAGGSGRSLTVISLTIPSIPSEPTNNPIKSKPVLFL
jgi:3-methyladenine DNA glycosylase/8-oxoguanine DNA glycosylase